jgi:hypothetical protein
MALNWMIKKFFLPILPLKVLIINFLFTTGSMSSKLESIDKLSSEVSTLKINNEKLSQLNFEISLDKHQDSLSYC